MAWCRKDPTAQLWASWTQAWDGQGWVVSLHYTPMQDMGACPPAYEIMEPSIMLARLLPDWSEARSLVYGQVQGVSSEASGYPNGGAHVSWTQWAVLRPTPGHGMDMAIDALARLTEAQGWQPVLIQRPPATADPVVLIWRRTADLNGASREVVLGLYLLPWEGGQYFVEVRLSAQP